jgi:hypothetical protein
MQKISQSKDIQKAPKLSQSRPALLALLQRKTEQNFRHVPTEEGSTRADSSLE